MKKTITGAIIMYLASMPVHSITTLELEVQKKRNTESIQNHNSINRPHINEHLEHNKNHNLPPMYQHYENSEIIINTLPNGSYFRSSTRTLPIIIERNYYNTIPEPSIQEPIELTHDQQQSNLRLITNVLSTPLVAIVDLGFGYLVPGPNDQIFYHSKITQIAPMPIEQFLSSNEYFYLTGDRR